jgi:hypothetical protein
VPSTSFCTTTVGSTIQTLIVCRPGLRIRCVVTVRFMLSEVLRSHWRFMAVSSAPVALVMFTTCGRAPSIETAYLSPSGESIRLRGDRWAQASPARA